MTGPVGAAARRHFTAVGDRVNLASRLEGANKAYGTWSLVTDSVARVAAREFLCREIDLVAVKGTAHPVRIHELLAPKAKPGERASELARVFAAGLAAYRARKWDQAAKAFTLLVEKYKDTPSRVFLDRIRHVRRPAAGEGLERRLDADGEVGRPAVRARPSATSTAPLLIVAALVVAAATVAAPRAGAQSRVFEGRWNWEHPNELRLAEDEVFPHTPYGRGWQTHSWYWIGRLDNGYLVVMNPFQWRYGALGAWGMYVIVRDPRGRVFTWDGKIGRIPEVAPRGMRVVADNARFESRTGVHRWTVDVPGFSCDFTFTNVLPAWKPGDGMARFDDDSYARLPPARAVGRPRGYDDRRRDHRRRRRPMLLRHHRVPDAPVAHPHGKPRGAGVERAGHPASGPVVRRHPDHDSRTPVSRRRTCRCSSSRTATGGC